MKFQSKHTQRTTACLALFLGCLTVSAPLNAQQQRKTHSHYTVIDLGTFGGPHSGFNGGSRIINPQGLAVGYASTSIPDHGPLCDDDPPFCHVAQAGKYENGVFTDLLSLFPGTGSFADAINSYGVVAGISATGPTPPGYPKSVGAIWKNGKIINLGTLGGVFSLAADINDLEVVAGGATNAIPDPNHLGGDLVGLPAPTQWRAAIWEHGTTRDLGTLGTGPDAFAVLLNQNNQVIGFSYTNSVVNPKTGIPTVHPFLWENGVMTDLGSLGGVFAEATGLNDSGQVVGFSDITGDLTSHPFLWQRGSRIRDLGTLGGSKGTAAWINNAGHVVGNANLAGDQAHHGFLWVDGTMQDLAPAGDAPCSNAFSINASDQVVGNTTDCNGHGLGATLWEQGETVDLNSFIPPGSNYSFTESVFIGDGGEIAVSGAFVNGDVHGFILLPDGDCNDSCQAEVAANRGDAKLVIPLSARQANDAQGTPLDRFRNMMRQRYQSVLQASTAVE